jgi:CarD family transcriptional regulator
VFVMFSIGDRISHPLHGAGIIDGIEEREINGKIRRYYVFKLPAGGMLVMLPIDHCEEIGIRPIISECEADALLEEMSDIEIDMTQNWNRRYRENMLRIKSGNLLEVARVIKGLMARESEKGLSTGERKMLRSAKQILISELVLSKKCSYSEVEAKLNKVLS